MKAASPHAERDATMNTTTLHTDDEMALWLCPAVDDSQDSASQYSMDPRLEDHYCSEFFGQLPNVQSLRDDFTAGICAPGLPTRNPPSANPGGSGGSKTPSADAAMALGAGRAAGLLPQAGVEAFTKVRTTCGKWSANSQTNTRNTISGVALTSLSAGVSPPSLSPVARDAPSLLSPMLPPKSQPVPARTGTMNFPHFSLPAVQMKANLQSLGMSHLSAVAKTTSGLSRPFNAKASSGSSIAESTITRQPSGTSEKDTTGEGSEGGGQQQSLGTESRWPSSMQNSLSSKESETAVNSSADHLESDSIPPADLENPRLNSGGVTGDKCTSQGAELQDPQEPTLTSSSGGSGISADRGKGATSRGKKRSGELDESECQSDDADEEVVEPKKTQPRGSSSKRTRAAEVHNLSERRRRDRINEKMKALQELIPNSNKADKASMLDEAIEYLKMLQIQLQMMSMRSGMSIPPLIPTGMQHLQMPQMGPMGMGIRMSPMVGMGMMDVNSIATGRPPSHLAPQSSHGGPSHSGLPLMPHLSHGVPSYSVSQMMPTFPSHGGPSHSVSATSPALSMVDPHNVHLQNNSTLDSVYLSRQHPPTHATAQDYHTYSYHHHHQQQQQQHQLQQ